MKIGYWDVPLTAREIDDELDCECKEIACFTWSSFTMLLTRLSSYHRCSSDQLPARISFYCLQSHWTCWDVVNGDDSNDISEGQTSVNLVQLLCVMDSVLWLVPSVILDWPAEQFEPS